MKKLSDIEWHAGHPNQVHNFNHGQFSHCGLSRIIVRICFYLLKSGVGQFFNNRLFGVAERHLEVDRG